MSIAIPGVLKDRKYPFVFIFFLSLVFVTLILVSNSQNPLIPIQSDALSRKEDPASSTDTSPPTSPVSANTSSKATEAGNSKLDENGESPSANTTVFNDGDVVLSNGDDQILVGFEWDFCKGSEAVDYIPCLDNWEAIKALKSRRHMEHRERHCPDPSPRCLVPLPNGYRVPVPWPKSRDTIWYYNVPHPKLVEYKKNQRWVVKSGEYFIFPGGGTQFKEGVDHYIESIEKTLPAIQWGKKTRVILDVGCGVASFGGSLLDRDVLTMSFAPKDEHEAQIQFALERGIPATLSVIGTQKLTFPSNCFDMIHCARCRVHWDADGGKPLMELNRILRPGGYFIWSATPVYRNDERDQAVWKSMVALTESICWSVAAKTYSNSSQIGFIIYQKPTSASCYQSRKQSNPPLCDRSTQPNISWYSPLDSCLVPLEENPPQWPSLWPERLGDKPPRLSNDADADAENFREDTQHWSALVSEVYIGALGLNWSSIRNIMDMNAGYGGFAAALITQPVWVMNVVPIHESDTDTLPVIYDRGLIGIYHDWCESFNTYPRTYDLVQSSFLLGNLTKRCDVIEIAAEIDRILRPGGYLVVQDTMDTIAKLRPVLKSLNWSMALHQDQFLVGKKGFWRPNTKS